LAPKLLSYSSHEQRAIGTEQSDSTLSFPTTTRAARAGCAFNDRRWRETEIKVDESGPGIVSGFSFGDLKTNSRMRIDEKGQSLRPLWSE